ncbi:MAG: SUMF1/EgtB/PvdO family nonheme iron enzyme [Muribaculaceae bacterium]|nr:SUMF1/EgtB/PvdO family nonheme iron enzyme [Muribaculaceae bacterium]
MRKTINSNAMKKFIIRFIFAASLCSISSCGNSDEPSNGNNGNDNTDKVKVYLTYTLDTSTGGNMARPASTNEEVFIAKSASTNEEVFNEFYEEIKTGELLAPSYDITFTNVDNGATYNFKGNWADNDFVTLRTGTYNVTGYSTATGDHIQDKCSIVFNEQINISITSKVVTLNAEYDCSLLIFNDEAIQSLHNYSGDATASFYSFKTYKYAFVNDCLYKVSSKNEAYIIGKYTNDAEFLIYTGNLNFEKGKYYVYNSVSNGLSFPPMTEGDEDSNLEIFANISYTELVAVKGGTFLMGAQSTNSSLPNYDQEADSDEAPVHQVTLNDFYICKYEATQQLWEYVMNYSGICADGTTMTRYSSSPWLGNSPSSSYGVGDWFPAYYVSYNDIVNIFLPRLKKITGRNYRLPTEAEWEYAARGGNKSQDYKYSGSNNIDDIAWYNGNSSKSHQVGLKQPNELNLYDMTGNVCEWCSDYSGSYSSQAQTSPTGPSTGSYHIRRGGSWDSTKQYSRISNRPDDSPGNRQILIGFRLCCSNP